MAGSNNDILRKDIETLDGIRKDLLQLDQPSVLAHIQTIFSQYDTPTQRHGLLPELLAQLENHRDFLDYAEKERDKAMAVHTHQLAENLETLRKDVEAFSEILKYPKDLTNKAVLCSAAKLFVRYDNRSLCSTLATQQLGRVLLITLDAQRRQFQQAMRDQHPALQRVRKMDAKKIQTPHPKSTKTETIAPMTDSFSDCSSVSLVSSPATSPKASDQPPTAKAESPFDFTFSDTPIQEESSSTPWSPRFKKKSKLYQLTKAIKKAISSSPTSTKAPTTVCTTRGRKHDVEVAF